MLREELRKSRPLSFLSGKYQDFTEGRSSTLHWRKMRIVPLCTLTPPYLIWAYPVNFRILRDFCLNPVNYGKFTRYMPV